MGRLAPARDGRWPSAVRLRIEARSASCLRTARGAVPWAAAPVIERASTALETLSIVSEGIPRGIADGDPRVEAGLICHKRGEQAGDALNDCEIVLRSHIIDEVRDGRMVRADAALELFCVEKSKAARYARCSETWQLFEV